MEYKETIKEYGLTDKETDIYLSALYLGTGSITQLAKKAGLKRPTTYLIIDELLKKNLLISIPAGKKVLYRALPPEKLIENLEAAKEKISAIMPALKLIQQQNSKKPKVRFYEGKDKLFSVYEEIFKAKEIWAVFSYERFIKIFSEKDNHHFFNILIRHGGKIYDLVQDTKKIKILLQDKHRYGVSETKLLPKNTGFSVDILVFEDKTAIISFPNLMAVIIEDENIAKSQKTMIKLIWDKL